MGAAEGARFAFVFDFAVFFFDFLVRFRFGAFFGFRFPVFFSQLEPGVGFGWSFGGVDGPGRAEDRED